ncbi:MAG TPA: helix-turn-helix domain-containing protein [Actinobacteria bacterium]|jgi:excisionase family DNA binding protein|nr:helix-turn-helix domain-containing protein [Actinomycetota bacterium]
MSNEEKLYTIKDLSDLVGISETEIINLIMQKKLKAIRIDKAVRVKESDLENFLDFFVGSSNLSERNSVVFPKESELVLYSAEQVAKILQLSVDNVWSLLKNGKLKGFKVREGRSSWRITSENLKDFIEERTRNLI